MADRQRIGVTRMQSQENFLAADDDVHILNRVAPLFIQSDGDAQYRGQRKDLLTAARPERGI